MKNLSKSQIIKLSFILLLIATIALGFSISSLQKRVDVFEGQEAQTAMLLGEGKIPGYSCGVLSETVAKDLLKSDLSQKYGQGPAYEIQKNKAKQENLFWSDSCRYEDKENSARYIEFYVSSFGTEKDAASAFPDFLQQVNENEKLASDGYGQSLIYDNGVYYLLTDNKVIQVAASNGYASETKEFSGSVFKRLLN